MGGSVGGGALNCSLIASKNLNQEFKIQSQKSHTFVQVKNSLGSLTEPWSLVCIMGVVCYLALTACLRKDSSKGADLVLAFSMVHRLQVLPEPPTSHPSMQGPQLELRILPGVSQAPTAW